jgi:hypothetical protein
MAVMMPEPIEVRFVVHDAIEEFVREHVGFHPHDPNNVKDLARHIRNRLLEKFIMLDKGPIEFEGATFPETPQHPLDKPGRR